MLGYWLKLTEPVCKAEGKAGVLVRGGGLGLCRRSTANALHKYIAGHHELIAGHHRHLAEPHRHIAWHHELIAGPHRHIAGPHRHISGHHELIAWHHELIAGHHRHIAGPQELEINPAKRCEGMEVNNFNLNYWGPLI